jgi:hypothetical protein
MKKVISQCIEYRPARQYGLVFWSHGTGWNPDPSRLLDNNTLNAIGIDYSSDYQEMNINQYMSGFLQWNRTHTIDTAA